MNLRRPRAWGPWIRRCVQLACLALFVFLFVNTRFREHAEPDAFTQVFFHLDPLILAGTYLATYAVPAAALLALATLVATVLFGRVFCGWVCPLGTINHFAGWLRNWVRGISEAPARWSPWQRAKYYLLVILLVMAAFGVDWIGVFDPIALLYRSMTAAVWPALQYAVEDGSTAVYQADPHIGPLHATSATEPVYKFFRKHIFLAPRQAFLGGGLILALFAGIVLLNLVRPRFWCRYLCPAGALLGIFARRPLLLRLVRRNEDCNECGRCTIGCQGLAAPGYGNQWMAAECFACWNCVSTCNFRALKFKIEPPFRKRPIAGPDLGRRATLGAAAGGLAGLFLFRLTPQAQAKAYNPALIRPPGAREEHEFLQRCVHCGLCMKVCPTNGLQPATFEAGLEGVWTPMLVPKIGYCQYECNLCGLTCPTEAIKPLALDEKKKVRIGLATIDTTRCIPYAYERNCIVCEEHCPAPGKAIYTVETEITTRSGGKLVVKQPHVDPNKCTGCGICETKCPFADRAAIRITSANESRHLGNQPILVGIGDLDGAIQQGYGDPAAGQSDAPGYSDPYGQQ
ncbi:MAG TPA: 4Fe-4S binding protein [Candidatus Hydrogenedentes bacterium]|nr:4Fe-4S binding protein [Candidatus Hydrogenedentota bacterium]HQM48517.1 4Fe-4S binding protein [Candidatus Hydrogenedentota bacterium]